MKTKSLLLAVLLSCFFHLKSICQIETDTAFVADYTASKISFINLNVSLIYPSAFASVIRQASTSNKPISVTYNSKNNKLISCKLISLTAKKKINKEITFLSNTQSFVTGVQTATTDTLGTNLRQSISKSEMINLFNFLASLSCKNSTTCRNGNMPCITFQYKANGCQARAHLMRYYIEDSFNIESKKIFLFGSLHAKNSENCGGDCISWGWHVAPLVNEIDSVGVITPKVIDPSLFTEPVTIEQWKNAQVNCENNSRIDTTYVMDSRFYSWNYAGRGSNKKRVFYEDDNNYGSDSYTLDFLRSRCKKCNQ